MHVPCRFPSSFTCQVFLDCVVVKVVVLPNFCSLGERKKLLCILPALSSARFARCYCTLIPLRSRKVRMPQNCVGVFCYGCSRLGDFFWFTCGSSEHACILFLVGWSRPIVYWRSFGFSAVMEFCVCCRRNGAVTGVSRCGIVCSAFCSSQEVLQRLVYLVRSAAITGLSMTFTCT